MEKSVHIVFRVLNFLYSDDSKKYNLIANDERILINLSHHNGPYGIFPSVTKISKELRLSRRYIMQRINLLEYKELLLIKKIPGKRNHYKFLFL